MRDHRHGVSGLVVPGAGSVEAVVTATVLVNRPPSFEFTETVITALAGPSGTVPTAHDTLSGCVIVHGVAGGGLATPVNAKLALPIEYAEAATEVVSVSVSTTFRGRPGPRFVSSVVHTNR